MPGHYFIFLRWVGENSVKVNEVSVVVVVKSTCPKRRPWNRTHTAVPGSQVSRTFSGTRSGETFPDRDRVFILMHRLARSFVTAAAGCSKTTSAATRLAVNWQRSAAARSTLHPWPTSCRTIHVRVPLPYKVEGGMGDFLSPAALKVIAEDYQQGLLDRLNEQVKGNAFVSCQLAYLLGVGARRQVPTLKI
jgi:hypothetical protein